MPALVAFDDFEFADMLTTQQIYLRTKLISRGSGEIAPVIVRFVVGVG